jgi:hypothetical protein
MTAFIARIESPLLRGLLWTVWFPVPALEFVAAFTLLGIARCFLGIGRVFFTLLAMYLVGLNGFDDDK